MSITKETAYENVINFIEHYKLMNGYSPRSVAVFATSDEGRAMLTGTDSAMFEPEVYDSTVSITGAVHPEFTQEYTRDVDGETITNSVLDRFKLIEEFKLFPESNGLPTTGETWSVDMGDSDLYPDFDDIKSRTEFFNLDQDGTAFTREKMVSHLVD